MSNSILVVAAHPDDEVLGCGATIAKHALNGDAVHIVILAEGVTSRDDYRDPERRSAELAELSKAASEVQDILGANSLILHDFADNRMDSFDRLDIIKVIERHVREYSPEIIYTHHSGDLNIDHRIVHEAVITASRPSSGCHVETILFFEVPSNTEWQMPGSAQPFVPNWFVNVEATLEKKFLALEAYRSEVRPWPHPRSAEAVTHLARWRGASIGMEAAEAFILGRHSVQ